MALFYTYDFPSVFQNDSLRQDLRDYQRQMESQRESLLQRRGDDMDYADKLRQKNRELNNQMEEIQVSLKNIEIKIMVCILESGLTLVLD